MKQFLKEKCKLFLNVLETLMPPRAASKRYELSQPKNQKQ